MSAKKVLLSQFDLHTLLFNNVIADISDEESNKCIAEPTNSVKWLAGHLLWANGNLSKFGGSPVTMPWRDHFFTKEGATPDDYAAPKSEMPTLAQIKNKWNEDAVVIRQVLENLPEEALSSEVEFKHPIIPFDNTLAGFLAFINDHQSYHIGQIGLLRRSLGKDAMKYF